MHQVDLSLPSDFQPTWIQTEIIESPTRITAACCGRRVGKTFVGPLWLMDRIMVRVAKRWDLIRQGAAETWFGLGLPARQARFIQPDVYAWICAPRDTQLDEARGNLLRLFAAPGWRQFVHPAFDGGIYDRGRQFWLLFHGVCVRIDFVPASSETRMVGRGIDCLWIDESGYIDNARYRALKPATMDRKADIFASGTPSLGDQHWFSRLCASGVEPDHERFDPSVAERDPEVTTIIADTINHAALPEAREEAQKEAAFWGPDWAAQWIYADWRMKGRHVFREYNAGIHVVDYDPSRLHRINRRRLPRPDYVIGTIDWSGGAAPGAAVVSHCWRRNVLSETDPRPLIIHVEDHMGTEPYTDDGWWRILKSLDQRYGVDKWLADPHAPELIRQAQRKGLYVVPGAHADKSGRITLIAGLLHHERGQLEPSMYIARRCRHLTREFATYSWKVDRSGQVTDKPKQYDDHAIDCVAMLVSDLCGGGSAVAIGGRLYS